MNRRILIMAFLMTIVIPGIVYGKLNKWQEPQITQKTTILPEEERFCLTVINEETAIEMELEKYVECVLLGEIPSDFETETLKAQAVATRTYTIRKLGKNNKHEPGVMCTDSTCCQAFCLPDKYLDMGGSADYIARIREAVSQTNGEVLLYDGDLIEATYFSASGGRTEAAVEVWGKDIPYLQSVTSLGEDAEQYEKQCISFTHDDFLGKLNLLETHIGRTSCSNILYTPGNGIKSMEICGKIYTGKQLRELLQLPSTVFRISVEEDTVNVVVDGNGHRVGMSQYGADAMAVQGKTYQEILAHYYPGTNLHQMTLGGLKGVFDKAGNL